MNTFLTNEQIIALRKATKPADYSTPWGDTIAFARAIEAQVTEEITKRQNYETPTV